MKQNYFILQIITLANISLLLTACNVFLTKPTVASTSIPVINTISPKQTPIPTIATTSPTHELSLEDWLSMQNPVSGLAWSIDGKTLAVSANSGVYTFDTHTNLIIHILAEGEFLFPLVMDSQGKRLFAGNRVWDIASGQLLYQLLETNISAAAFSPDGNTLAINNGKSITLWDAITGKELHKSWVYEFKGTQWERGLTYSTDGNFLYASSDHKVMQVNLASGQVTTLFTFPEDGCCTIFSPDAKYMILDLTNHGLGSQQLWGVGNGELVKDSGNCDSDVSFSVFSPDSKHFIIGCGLESQLWDIPTHQLIHKFPFITSLSMQPNLTPPIPTEWRSAVFNQDNTKIALGNNFGEVLIWDVNSYQLINTISIPLP